jgi:uncharacterized metal-binding protein (TIGR02443 family)
VKKRFIAGARCPTCGAEDRVRLFMDDSGRIDCVACGFEGTRTQAPQENVTPVRIRLDRPVPPPGPATATLQFVHNPRLARRG